MYFVKNSQSEEEGLGRGTFGWTEESLRKGEGKVKGTLLRGLGISRMGLRLMLLSSRLV
jgi:hypothetical protein